MNACKTKEKIQFFASMVMIILSIAFALLIPYIEIDYSTFSPLGLLIYAYTNDIVSLLMHLFLCAFIVTDGIIAIFSLVRMIKEIYLIEYKGHFGLSYMTRLSVPFSIILVSFVLASVGAKLNICFYIFLAITIAWFVLCLVINFLKPFSNKEKKLLITRSIFLLASFVLSILFFFNLIFAPFDDSYLGMVIKVLAVGLLCFSYPNYIYVIFYDVSCVLKNVPQVWMPKIQHFLPLVFFIAQTVASGEIEPLLFVLACSNIIVFIASANIISTMKKRSKMTQDEINRVYLGSPMVVVTANTDLKKPKEKR